jgi:hypothetical protein
VVDEDLRRLVEMEDHLDLDAHLQTELLVRHLS